MSSNVNDINSEHSPSQSPEISSERFIAKSLSGTSALERNAWVRLKTITTFDSGTNKSPGVTHEELSNEPSHFHSNKHFPRYRELSKQEKTYVEQMNVKLDVNESHHVYVSNSSLSQVPERAPLHVSYRKLADKEIYEANLNQRRRKRSQSNSLSESNVPYENVADPITSCSVRCSPQRNGSVSDIGVDRTNTSMGSGSPVQSLTRFSPTSLLVESLIDQLCKLMERDSGKQKKLYHVICQRLHQMQLIDDTYTIEEFQFMRSHYQKALYQLLAVAKSSTQSSGTRNILLPLPSSNINVDLKVNSEKILEWSRYQHEYQELEYIAKGGFGHVYKVRNKLDGCEYAIKKIYLRYRHVKGFLQSLKEVKMLARLNHPNIVSYKAAWLEPMDDEKQEPQSQRSSGNSASHDASVSVVSINSISKFPLPPAPKDTTEDSLDIVFQESSPENKSSSSKSPESHQNSSRLAPKYDSQMQPPADLPDPSLLDGKISSSESSSCHSCSTETGSSRSSTGNAVCPINTRESKKMYPPSSISVRKWATLYVQMQLCERTLRHWLDERNKSLPAHPLASESSEGMLALNLFRQIVRGVDYIHAQGIVHHDIKPSNIFVNANLKEVQVGDFGLSCCILSRVDSSGVLGDHHGEVGTRLYAAPEQLQGKCTSKSDVYSLGIVFLELLHPFHTDMERSKVIQKLRIGHVPPDLTRAWPLAARLISDLLMVSPAARPSASYLLQCLNSLLQSNLENELSSRLALKDETIRLLQETVASRDREIAELRQRLSLFERQ